MSCAGRRSWLVMAITMSLFVCLWGGNCRAWTVEQNVQALVTRAKLQESKGNVAAALRLYGQALRLRPDDLSLWYGRALLYGKAGRYGKAINEFTYVINRGFRHKNRQFPHAVRFRADCYLALGWFGKARDDYLAFLNFAPKDGKVWFYLAETFVMMRRNDLALQAISSGLATGSHWKSRLRELRTMVMLGNRITPHKPLSN